jgi:hypothetical protein
LRAARELPGQGRNLLAAISLLSPAIQQILVKDYLSLIISAAIVCTPYIKALMILGYAGEGL